MCKTNAQVRADTARCAALREQAQEIHAMYQGTVVDKSGKCACGEPSLYSKDGVLKCMNCFYKEKFSA